MVKEVSLEKLLDKCDNSVYKLVVLASKRAIELSQGEPALIQQADGTTTKPSTVALLEIAEGKIKFKKK